MRYTVGLVVSKVTDTEPSRMKHGGLDHRGIAEDPYP